MKSSVLASAAVLLLAAAAPASDWNAVGAALGRSGTLLPGNVYKVGFPRTDLAVTVGGVSIRPALALGSWAAFLDTGKGTMTMGDLVLLEPEINPVIATLQKGGIEQSALHNHLIGETPHVMYLHFSGHGDAVALARTLHAALSLTKTPMGPMPAAPNPQIPLPVAEMNGILGATGNPAGGTLQFSFPRRGPVTEHGITIPPSMGVATAINFQPTGNGHAAITGDFVMVASEVNPVIRALQSGGIAITALHGHMLDEQPRLFFMHFWANDDAVKLARTLRTALDQMDIKK